MTPRSPHRGDGRGKIQAGEVTCAADAHSDRIKIAATCKINRRVLRGHSYVFIGILAISIGTFCNARRSKPLLLHRAMDERR